jgi:phenylacetate-coenzyme A ligase PaaK-like adenylate-forming protein
LRSTEALGKMNQEQVCAFRDARLRAFVKHAVETTPHYCDLFGKLGISPDDIRSLQDLHALPVLTKAEVQDAPKRFISTAIQKNSHVNLYTSGTTGSGLHVATTILAHREQWAVWWRYRRWHGIEPGTWCGHFGGSLVVPVGQKLPPFWRINFPGRQILFSAYHSSPDNLVHYLDELRRRHPPWLHGYPSSLALVASQMLDVGYDLGYQPRWITVGSESLMPHQAALVEAAFGRKPLQHYGMVEGVANISQCEAGALHVDEDYSAVEFLEEKAAEACRIVGTNFTNLATPLLRYDVGDLALLSTEACQCGRPGRTVSRLDGRQDDYVVARNGAKVGRLSPLFRKFVNIKEAQIRQSRPGEINVIIVKRPTYDVREETDLRQVLQSRLGAGMDVRISYAEKLERSKHGKLRFVVSEIPVGTNAKLPA